MRFRRKLKRQLVVSHLATVLYDRKRRLHWFLLVYRLEERPRDRGLCERLSK